MRVIPVIDLLHGQVVRGIGGRRSEYRPIQSQIASDPRAAAVARVFAERFGFGTLYVADLDAIMEGRFSAHDWRKISAAGMKLWLDAGVGNAIAARKVMDYASEASIDCDLVIGMESLNSPQELSAIQELCTGRAFFSLDMRSGEALTRIKDWKSFAPTEIVAEAVSRGTNKLIVLDLADVGEAGGTRTLQLCRELRNNHPQIEIIAGGGVRGLDDLRALADAGCDATLVASALHDGRLTRPDMESLSPLL